MTDEDEPQEHTCGEQPVEAQRWSFWFLPGMIFNLFANLGRACISGMAACVNFCEEVGHAFYAHGLYKQKNKEQDQVVDSFRDQLARF